MPVNLKVCSKGQNQNSQCDVGVKTAPSALFWCGKVMIDHRSDQLGDACVCFHARTFIQTPGGRVNELPTHSPFPYTVNEATHSPFPYTVNELP